jgi:hypothetical protein
MRDDNAAPKIPIPGAQGQAVAAALSALAMHPGSMIVTIAKERLPQGGYIYLISKTQPPGNG